MLFDEGAIPIRPCSPAFILLAKYLTYILNFDDCVVLNVILFVVNILLFCLLLVHQFNFLSTAVTPTASTTNTTQVIVFICYNCSMIMKVL